MLASTVITLNSVFVYHQFLYFQYNFVHYLIVISHQCVVLFAIQLSIVLVGS